MGRGSLRVSRGGIRFGLAAEFFSVQPVPKSGAWPFRGKASTCGALSLRLSAVGLALRRVLSRSDQSGQSLVHQAEKALQRIGRTQFDVNAPDADFQARRNFKKPQTHLPIEALASSVPFKRFLCKLEKLGSRR